MRVNVTARDIKLGKRSSPTECPIARAIKRKARGLEVSLGLDTVTFYTEDLLIGRLYLPEIAHEFISRFDHEEKVEPLEFELAVPKEWEKELRGEK